MLSSLDGADVLVTGGNGFIGCHLVRRLIELGASVHVFSLNSNNLHDIIDKINFYRVDVRDYDSVKTNVEKIEPQKIFHLAAVVNVSRDVKEMEPIVDVKIKGTLNLIKSMDDIDCDCFVNTGTCEEYGQNKPPFREDMTPMPVSPYSAANASMTIFCKMLYETNGFPITTLRQFTCYGPGQKPSMLIPYVIISALKKETIKMTGGKQKRDFNYIDDAVESFILASTEKKSLGEVINIGTGESRKIKGVVGMILDMMGNPVVDFGSVPYRKTEIWDIRADNSKAKTVIGWEPKTSLQDGLKKTIEWYKNSIS
ncbi:MAG: SDR family NAD(P)-dependent oxidoreductase [Candidatus Aenigmarchaeota archaeon]|nr:SDR family NAD(P)-dependent oxidoreductase [Candidatus Aenigmarchaeota archaeon]MDI6722349.1 SDR family NAD(P)-dependent oxidoreductase [Candidatus Aenigmarchaeota archaeon]